MQSANWPGVLLQKNRQTDPKLQDGEFEIYAIPSSTYNNVNDTNPEISYLSIQLNNALTNPIIPIPSMLQIVKTLRVTRSKPV